MRTKAIVGIVALVLLSFGLGWISRTSLQRETIALPIARQEKEAFLPSGPEESIPPAIAISRGSSKADRIKREMVQQGEPNPRYQDTMAVLETSKGKIVFRLFYEKAPRTVTDFGNLAERGFYDGMNFLRKEEGIGISAGKIPQEFVFFKFKDEPGVAKSRAGSFGIAKSTSSPYYLNYLYFGYTAQPKYEKEFTIMGEAVEGLDILTQLQPGDVIQSMKILKE